MKYFLATILLVCISCGSTVETWEVNGRKVPCEGANSRDCFQVKKDSSGAWENEYADIEGFYFEPGYDYVLKVRVSDRDKVPQGASAKKYTLAEIVSKKKMETIPNGTFEVVTMQGSNFENAEIQITFDAEDKRVYGKNICNRYSGSFSAVDGQLQMSPVTTTRKMCDRPNLERQFLTILKEVDAFAIADDMLYLRNGNDVLITAKKRSKDE